MASRSWYAISRGVDDASVTMTDDAIEVMAVGFQSSGGKSVVAMTDDEAAEFVIAGGGGAAIRNAMMKNRASEAAANAAAQSIKKSYAANIKSAVASLKRLPSDKQKEIIGRVWATSTTVWTKSPAARGWSMSVYDMTVGSDTVDEAITMDSEFLRNMKDWADMTMKAGMVVSNPRAATKTGTGLKVVGIFALAGASISFLYACLFETPLQNRSRLKLL